MEVIRKYFPHLGEGQLESLHKFSTLVRDWNTKVNLISRKDIDNLEERHILHSLFIAHVFKFEPDAHVLDLGTGGGFPGIPLAIVFPKTKFTLIDARAKKIKAVNAMIAELKLQNCSAFHQRAEECEISVDYVVIRAVASLSKLLAWSRPLLKSNRSGDRARFVKTSGKLLALKGGDISEEVGALPQKHNVKVNEITDHFNQEFFADKYLIELQVG